MNRLVIMGSVALVVFGGSVFAAESVKKLDCRIEVPKEKKHQDPFAAQGYKVDYYPSHGTNGRAFFAVEIMSKGFEGENAVLIMTEQPHEDGAKWTSPEDAVNAAVEVTQFVKVEGSKVLVGDTRACPSNPEGKRCQTSSYGYTLDLETMIFVPEDTVRHNYHCVENADREVIPHDDTH